MAKLKHKIEYIFAWFLISMVQSLSEKAAGKFARGLGRLAYHFMPNRRKIACENLEKASLINLTDKEIDQTIKEVFENISCSFFESARLDETSFQQLSQISNPSGVGIFDKLKALDKGAVFVTAHFGNWEFSGAWVGTIWERLHVVVKTQSNPLVDKMLSKLRENLKLNIIKSDSTALRELFKNLKEKNPIGLIADQHDPSENLVMDFFGRKAAIAKGPASFAVKFNAPLVPLLMRRTDFNKFEVEIGEIYYPPQTGNNEEDIKKLTRQYLDYLEKIIALYPSQWMWTHRRWKVK